MSSPLPRLPLDASLYRLQDNELAFFKTQTGIYDEKELKEHILTVQAEAYAVYPYPCIRGFAFTSLKISKYPIYDAVLKLGRERPGAILLDVGCCFGSDVRKAVADGYPLDNVIASDIQPDFWTLGHKLFRSSRNSFPVTFIPGDILNPDFLAPNTIPAPSKSTPPSHVPPLSRITSLTELQHHISVIHASSFFHLFEEKQQHTLAHLLGSLLSPLPGAVIFGSHTSVADTEENREGGIRITKNYGAMFGHSPSSWEKLWMGNGGVFKPGDVVLSTKIVELGREDIMQVGGDPTDTVFYLVWSVTRT